MIRTWSVLALVLVATLRLDAQWPQFRGPDGDGTSPSAALPLSWLQGEYSASPLLAAGRVYFFNEEGRTTLLEAGRAFKVLAENQLGDGFMASPAVDGDAPVLRSRTHLYRVE
jgi:hypothetical protein